MNKLLLLVFAFAAESAAAQSPYDLGQKLNAGSLLYIPKQHCLTRPATVEPCIRVRTRGVTYTIGYRAKGKVITYIETHDSAFTTVEGLRVGSRLNGSAGSLIWKDAFGEAVGPDTSDGWQPIVAYDRTLQCDNGAFAELSAQKTGNSEACPLRVLGFKKRAAFPTQATNRMHSLGIVGQ